METVAKHIIFTGTVQGVGFRFTALNIANRYGLVGLVRNLPDGTVEMIAQGTATNINDCICDITKSFSGYIRDTKITEVPLNSEYSEFKITF